MNTYYVSTSGNNGNSGTSTGAAWRTIQHAVTNVNVNAGDTIRVMPGTYAENVQILSTNGGREGTPGSPITLISHDANDMAVITGPEGRHQIQIFNRSHWTIDSIAIKNYTTGGIFVQATLQNVVGITIQNCLLENQNASRGIMWHAIVLDGREPYASSYCYILNNTLRNIKTGPSTGYNETITMHHNVHHCLIEGNQVWGTTYIGLNAIANDYIWGIGKPSQIIFRNNRVDSVAPATPGSGARTGLYVDGADYVLYENNYITLADGMSVSAECWSAKGKFTAFRNNIVRNNVLDGTGGNSSIMLTLGADHYTVFTEADPNASQKWVDDSVVVHNVMLINNARGGAFKWGFCRRARVKNNVMVNYAAGSLITYIMALLTPNGWQSDGNLYWRPGNPAFSWPNAGNPASLAALQSASGQDYNSVYGQPVFATSTRTALEHYKLASTSPGYGSGVALTTATNSGSSSTNLVVNDARYFCDGYGLISGDTISVGGTEATISLVNYDTNTITLSSAISWSTGASVGYATNPSIGIIDSATGEWVQTILANAGIDQTLSDADRDGSVLATLSGTGFSPVGITAYTWSLGGATIATTATAQVSLPLGTHQITLTVTDADNDTATDTMTVRVVDPGDIVSATTVRNPCLSGFDSWLAYSSGSTTWEAAPSGTGIEVTVTSDGGNTQLSQNDLIVQAGQILKLRIVGEAIGVQQSFDVSLFKDTSPWTNYGLYETVTFATTETVIEREFVVTYGASDARLMAKFVTGHNVIIRELNLLDPDENGCYNENDPGTVVSSGSLGVTSTDDYFGEAGGQFYENGNPTYAGDYRSLYNNYDQFTGWIFVADTAIPDGAEITSATLKVTAGGYQGSLPKLRVDIENAADPSKPTSASDAAGRAWLTGSAWQSVAWTNTVQYTIDIDTAIVQSLIDAQGGIENGANIHVKLTDADPGFQAERLAYITTAAAELDIAWDAPAAGGTFAEEINPLRPGVRVGLKQGF